jgi:hypothetical protein
VEAISFHHEPAGSGSGSFSPTVAVHAANYLTQVHDGTALVTPIDEEFMKRTGFIGSLEVWKGLVV